MEGQAVAVAQRARARKPRARRTCLPGQPAIPMMMLMLFQKHIKFHYIYPNGSATT
jgi:hypothetical protein